MLASKRTPSLDRSTLQRIARQLADTNPGCAIMLRVGTENTFAPAQQAR